MNIQFMLAARYLSGRKLRTFLTTLAVIFGVTIIFALNGMLPAFSQAFRENMLAATGAVVPDGARVDLRRDEQGARAALRRPGCREKRGLGHRREPLAEGGREHPCHGLQPARRRGGRRLASRRRQL